MTIKLIIGLGNPGSAYQHTRHNAGAWFVYALALQHQCALKLDKKMQAELTDLEINQHACKLGVPTTFMNHSGQPVRALSQFYKIAPEEILIAHDELDLPLGTVKFKTGGGHGGHNGLRDITSQLGSPQFHRLRFGIGHPGHKDLVHDYVLSKPSIYDKQLIQEAIDKAVVIMPVILSGDIARAMNQLHT